MFYRIKMQLPEEPRNLLTYHVSLCSEKCRIRFNEDSSLSLLLRENWRPYTWSRIGNSETEGRTS